MSSILDRLIGYVRGKMNTNMKTGRGDIVVYCTSCEEKTRHAHWYSEVWGEGGEVYWRCEVCCNRYKLNRRWWEDEK